MVKRIKSLEANLESTERLVLDKLSSSNEPELAKRQLVEGYLIHMDNIKNMARGVVDQKGYSQEGLNEFFDKIDYSIETVMDYSPESVLKQMDTSNYHVS